MLLPSDMARLVLGYLQEEGLSATSRAFIHESPNLKEYAEHSTGDGTIPACVFSLFGKNLTTILNEYVAAKAKESGHEIPIVMTSLWKKLDFTLNQIKSLQNSNAISASQRTRSRIGVANMARQRVLAVASASGVVCSSVSETSSIISPAQTSHSMVGHSTPVSYAGPHTRAAASTGGAQQLIHDGSRLLNTPRDSPVQIIVSEHRINSGPISPARRKWDTPKKRSGLSAPSAPSRSAPTVSNINTEAEPEEVVDENFPSSQQLVIQNACDKILGDRLLQEKLAENINKILANELIPPASKASVSTVEAEQSIDEILGLQGEIHMSDDAIHDILEQTESDPAFQALFDLFDYHKTKLPDGEAVDGDASSRPEENETGGLSSAVQPFQSNDSGPAQQDADVSDVQPAALKTRAAQERKTRKSTVPTLLKKTILDPNGRASRIENSSARLLVTHGEHRCASSATLNSSRKEKPSLFVDSGSVTQMDIDEPLHTPPPPLDSFVTQEHSSTSITSSLCESVPVPLANDPATFTEPSNVNKTQESNEQPSTIPSSRFTDDPEVVSSMEVQATNTPVVTACVTHPSGSTSDGSTPSVSSDPATSACTVVRVTATSPSSPSAPAQGSSTSETLTAASSTPFSPASSCAPAAATCSPSTTNTSTPSKAANSSNIVSLKISIVSDSQEDDSSSDTALNQAISSISGEKIPTIYLSSPTKSPGRPATPKANFDEAAQAVCGLQSSEACVGPLSSKTAVVNTTSLIGMPQAQQGYIIQLPVDAASPGLQGSAASYFLMTPTTDVQSRQVLLPVGDSRGPPLPANQPGGPTPTYPQSFSTGSAFILPSPMNPMVLPVSVLGQNTVAKVQVVSNQLVNTSNFPPVQQKETINPSPTTSTASGTGNGVLAAVIQAEHSHQQDAAKGSSHKRILCFDSSSPEVQPQTAKTTETTTPVASKTSVSQSKQQTEKDKKTKPNILGGNRPRRRIEPVRCTADPPAGASLLKKSVPLQMHQKDSTKKNTSKQVHSIHNKEPKKADLNPEKRSKSGEVSNQTHTPDKCNDETKAMDADGCSSSDNALKPGSRKDKEESSKKEAADKAPLKSREGRTEKKTSSQEVPNVTANKENEMKGSVPEQQQQSTPSSSASRDFSPPAVTQVSPHTQPKTQKPPSKASSLAKQAVEMLQDMQGLNSPSTPVKKTGAGSSDLDLPEMGQTLVAPADRPRTPSRQKKSKDGEGSPKQPVPLNTPDVPTCSPASEAGSENSINMAAHTLMILSRAAIARTGTPLKDSMRQEGVGEMSPTSSKNSKKRKQASPVDSPSAKRETKRSPSRKKDQERKKLIDCFPHDLDVDKFLSSLHYDE